MVTIKIEGITLRSEMNARGHWGKRYRRASGQREAVAMKLRSKILNPPAPPLAITMTLHSAREITDDDNLKSAFKSVRDGVADALGIDDGDPGVTWKTEQQKALKGKWRGVAW